MMKSTTFLLVLVMCTIIIQDSAGWFFRWKRKRVPKPPPPPPPPAPCYCHIYCTEVHTCHSICCNGKEGSVRMTVQTRQEDIEKSNAVEVPYPADFSVYDANKDGIITLPEFTDAIQSHLDLDNPEHLTVVFRKGDKDGDGEIDEYEFMTAPWKFAEEGELEKLPDLD